MKMLGIILIVIGAVYAGTSVHLMSAQYGALSLACMAGGILMYRGAVFQWWRALIVLTLSSAAGTTLPAMVTDPADWWLIGLVAFVLLGLARLVALPLFKEGDN